MRSRIKYERKYRHSEAVDPQQLQAFMQMLAKARKALDQRGDFIRASIADSIQKQAPSIYSELEDALVNQRFNAAKVKDSLLKAFQRDPHPDKTMDAVTGILQTWADKA